MKHAILLKPFFFYQNNRIFKRTYFVRIFSCLVDIQPSVYCMVAFVYIGRYILLILSSFKNLIGKAGKYMSHDWSNQYWIGNLSQLVATSLSHLTSCRILFFKCSGALLM